jgi:hypothetical protein
MRNTAQGLFSVLSSGVMLSSTMWASGLLYGTLGGAAYFVMAVYAALAFTFAVILKAVSPRG